MTQPSAIGRSLGWSRPSVLIVGGLAIAIGGAVFVALVGRSDDSTCPPTAGYQPPAEVDPRVMETVRQWQAVLGVVELSDPKVFSHMLYLWPQPVERFTRITDQVVVDSVVSEFRLWAHRLFRGEFLAVANELEPSAYYLPEETHDTGLLLYEGAFRTNRISILENGNVLALVVRPDGYSPRAGVSQAFVLEVLSNWIDLSWPDKRDGLPGGFDLPAVLKGGCRLASSEAAGFRDRDWRNHLVVVVGEPGLMVLLFKINRDTARVGFAKKRSWLDGAIFRADGKTPIRPVLHRE